jgi:hypothetical protein
MATQRFGQLLEAVKSRRCILFLGAGVHYPPPTDLPQYQYPEPLRPPLGAALSRSLVLDSRRLMREGFPDKATAEPGARDEFVQPSLEKLRFLRRHRDDLQRTSWYYELEHARNTLVDFVGSHVNTGKEPSAIVRGLAELNFPVVITTNYDLLFENARKGHNESDPAEAINLTTCVYDPNPTARPIEYHDVPAEKECWFLKIHGCVTKPESIVITDEDYIKFISRMNAEELYHPIPARIRALMSQWTTLFVGYSLLDYNLRLLFRTLRWRLEPASRPLTFSVDRKPDYLIRATYEKGDLVSFIARDMWRAVPELYHRVKGRPMPP